MPQASPQSPPRLAMRGIGKKFAGVSVLSDVDFTVGAGEVVALLGANGAGKSTLVKILTGVYERDAGSVAFESQDVASMSPRQASAMGISYLPQEISVIPHMTVAENICIAAVPMRGGFVDKAAMRATAKRQLERLGFGHIDPDTELADLGVAERRVVEIARALAADASLLVMDEPTASLTEQEAETIFGIVRALRAENTSVIYISHYLKEVFAIADRIEILRDGRNAGTFSPAVNTPDEVVDAMIGRRAAGFLGETSRTIDGETVLEAQGISNRHGLHDISFSVRKGEIVGIFGLVGSGIERLGRLVFGAEGPRYSGSMRLNGKPYAASTPAHGKASGIGFVTAERKKDGILAELTVRENLVAPFQGRYRWGPFISRLRETEETLLWIDHLGVRTRGPEQEMRTLSGGNQQKVCVARWLVDPSIRLLVLEEPTRGVDVGARGEIYRELGKLAKTGLGILVLSSDVEEIAGLADTALVMDDGTIVAQFDRGVEPGDLMKATAAKPRPILETASP